MQTKTTDSAPDKTTAEQTIRTHQPQKEQKTMFMDHIDLTDTRFQVRQALDESVVKQYEEMITPGLRLSGFKTRPILWECPESKKYVICDGWHRIQAAIRAGATAFEADIVVGTEEDALIEAMRANLTHGLQLTSQERIEACRKTIEALTDESDKQPSNRVVAEVLGVSETSVRSYRDRLEKSGQLDAAKKVVGKDGVVQKTKRTGKKAGKVEANRAERASSAPVATPEITIVNSPEIEPTGEPVVKKADPGVEMRPSIEAKTDPLQGAENVVRKHRDALENTAKLIARWKEQRRFTRDDVVEAISTMEVLVEIGEELQRALEGVAKSAAA